MANDVSNGTSNKAKKVDVKTMSSKQYMDEMVVPTLLKALSVVNQKRPEDPIQFLAKYLNELPPESKSEANATKNPETADKE